MTDSNVIESTETKSPDLSPPATEPVWKLRRRQTEQMRGVLQRRFPLAFQKPLKERGEAKIPLKVNIHKDILAAAPDLDQYHVRWALRDYTSGLSYHQVAMVAGTTRIDLQGRPAGEVTERDAIYHARHGQRIKARNELGAAQRAAAKVVGAT